MNLRKLHRKLAPVLFIPLFIAALTGIVYRLGYSWFSIPPEVANFLMVLHQGKYLGEPLVPVYVLLVGLGLLGTIATGLTLIKRKRSASQPKKDWRWFHRILAPIAFLPLTVSALTGIAYRLGTDWFGLSNPQAAIFLRIHQGSYLGTTLKPIYVLLVGLGLMGLLMTGIQMSGIFRKRRPQTSKNS